MILPTRYLPADRSLIFIGGEIHKVLNDSPRTISEVWERVVTARDPQAAPLGYDWFLLAVTLLFAIGTVDMRHGLLTIISKGGQ